MKVYVKINKKNKMEKQNKKEIDVKKEGWFEPEGELVIDVYETNEEIKVRAPIAGIDSSDLEILIEGDILTIKGTRKESEEIPEEDFLLRECYFGSFTREVTLPEPIKKKEVRATVENGVLTVTLPKQEEKEGKRIEIEEK